MPRQRDVMTILSDHETGIRQIRATLARIGQGVSSIDDLGDVTITSVANDDVLQFTGTVWENQTLAEAGISADGHGHLEADISDLGDYLLASGDTVTGVLDFDGGTGGPGGSITAYDFAGREILLLEGGDGSLTDARIQVYGGSDASFPNEIQMYADEYVFNDLTGSGPTVLRGEGGIHMKQLVRPVTGLASHTQEPWSTSTIEMGDYGAVGTQGSFRLELAWNWERGTDSLYHHKNINSSAKAYGVQLGDDGIRFIGHQDYANNHTTSPPILMDLIRNSTPEAHLHVYGFVEINNEIRLGNGTAGNPSYTFTSDGNTGMYRLAEDDLGLVAGGRLGVRITDASGGFVTRIGGGTGAWRLDLDADGAETTPPYSFLNDPDTGMWHVATNQVGFSAGGDLKGRFWSGGLLMGDATTGNVSIDITKYTFYSDTDTYMQRNSANEIGFFTGGNEAMAIKNGGSGSSLELKDGLTDVGDHEVLRLNRGTGTTMQNVGYYSSWINDPETGEKRKSNIKPVAQSGKWWKREWFMDLEPIKYQRVAGKGRDYGKGRQIEMGFSIENLIENTPLLTTKGEQIGGTPSEFALLAVTIDYVQNLEKRVAALEQGL